MVSLQAVDLNRVVQIMLALAFATVAALNLLMSVKVNRSLPKERRFRYWISWFPWFNDEVQLQHRQLFPDSKLSSVTRMLDIITLALAVSLLRLALFNKQITSPN